MSPEELLAEMEAHPAAAEAGVGVLIGTFIRLAEMRPGMYIHPRVGEDGFHSWCIHQDDSGYGCRFPDLIEGLEHVIAVHVYGDGKNCGD